MSLALHSRRVGKLNVLRCTGRIVSGAEAVELQEQVKLMFADGEGVVLDLQDVTFMDSSGLGAMVRLATIGGSKTPLSLCAVPESIGKLLTLTRLDTVLKVYVDEDAAISAGHTHRVSDAGTKATVGEILCVVENIEVLALLREVLNKHGYGTLTSGNLPDAVVLMKAAKPKLLVATVKMAGLLKNRGFDVPAIELEHEFELAEAAGAADRLLGRLKTHFGA